MATYIKGEPGYEDEETIMRRITIKNEPDTSDKVIVTERNLNMIASSCSPTVDPAAETEYPLINQAFIDVKEEITVKDEYIQDDNFDKFSSNSNDKCSYSVENSQRHVSNFWTIDKDADQVNTITTAFEQHQHEIKTESDHAMADSESQIMITNVGSVFDGEDNIAELKINIPAEKRSELTGHNWIHTGEKPYKCQVCGHSFINNGDLINHKFIHSGKKTYKCRICEKSFTQSCHLKRHNRIHTGEKPYKCQVCGCAFIDNYALTKHNLIHSGKRPYKCSKCEKSFTQSSHLKRHNRTHRGDKPNKCQVCGCSFTNNCDFINHNLMHSGKRTYKCGICGKLFVRKTHLTSHSTVHTGEKPYKCKVCGRSFAHTSSLARHNKAHTGETA